jgi:uncharacterized membrane protein
MDIIKKSRLLFWSVVILAVLNVSLLATVWLAQHPGDNGRPDMQYSDQVQAEQFLNRELNLSGEQARKLREMRREHRLRHMQLMRDQNQLRRNVYLQLSQNGISEADSLHTLIGKNQEEISRHTFRHFREIRNILTDEQRERFDRVMRRSSDRMNPMGSGPRQGGMQRNER